MRIHRQKRPLPDRILTALAISLSLGISTAAQAAAIDNIRLTRIVSLTTVELELGCEMQLLGHTPQYSGLELRLSVSLGYDCINALRTAPSSLYRPRSGRLAHLTDVEFDSIAADRASISLRFDRPVKFNVRQTSNQYLLTVTVDTSAEAPAAVMRAKPKPVAAEPAAPPADRRIDRRSRDEGPSRSIPPPAAPVTDKFVLRLDGSASANGVDSSAVPSLDDYVVYVNEVAVGERQWQELRLGFFETESVALSVLEDIRPRFPSAWVAVAGPEEQAAAEQKRLRESKETELPSSAEAKVTATAVNAKLPDLESDRIVEMMSDAKASMSRTDYAKSIKIYTRLLEQAEGAHRREAREFLGVARQKNGQIAHAKAEFEAYLAEFPDDADSKRVRQRLAALTDPADRARRKPVAILSADTEPAGADWQYYGGVSQFYLRGVNLARDDEEDVLTQSALLSQADFFISRRGDRFDLLGRANVGYLYDFEDTGIDSQARVSYAYLDITDNSLDLSARLGRQTQHSGGVLGRFDGAWVSYGLWRNLSLNVTAGFPVASPRYAASADRYFYGASAELSDVFDAWDFSVFTNLQTVDGISDRQAFGGDFQYRSNRINVVGLLDYDTSYNALNTGLLIGTWRVADRLTLNARYQSGVSPFLTTRNAVIGQPVNTVAALMEQYTEGQIRRLARNRTPDAESASAGLTAEISQRWQLNADISYYELEATTASGGVEAFPNTGPQYIYGGYLLGSSLFKAGDSVIVGYRHYESGRSDSDTINVDMRYPIGERLRINPRLALTAQDRVSAIDGESDEFIINPMLRVLYRGDRRYRIELEVGGQWSDRELPAGAISPLAPDGSIESSSYYLQLGYWLDFR